MNRTIKTAIRILLKWVCQAILWRHKPVVVAITGSVGKTTTKDVVGHGLASVTTVVKAEKNHNTDFGVPLTIIGAPNPYGKIWGWINVIIHGIFKIFERNFPKVLVLEVGTRFPGDIPRLAKWLKPHVSIITHIPEIPVHIEFFGSRQAIVDEKSALAKYTRTGGTIILNRDSEYVFGIAENSTHPLLTIGFNIESDVSATEVERVITEDGQYGMKFIATVKGRAMPVFVPGFIAKHQIYGVLFALAASEALGYDCEQVALSMTQLKTTLGRLNPLLGVNNTLILDDSYNASPAAMEAAIETLASIETPGRHIAIVGDMLDLGKMTKEAHESIGEFLKSQKLDFICLVGPRMRYAYDALITGKYAKTKIAHFDTLQDAMPSMLTMLKATDVVLVKGSQGMRMEKMVYELIMDKENASHVLVRQEEDWKKK